MKFQNPTIHRSKVNGRTHRQTDKPKAICPSNFFKVGGIINSFAVLPTKQMRDAKCVYIFVFVGESYPDNTIQLLHTSPWHKMFAFEIIGIKPLPTCSFTS